LPAPAALCAAWQAKGQVLTGLLTKVRNPKFTIGAYARPMIWRASLFFLMSLCGVTTAAQAEQTVEIEDNSSGEGELAPFLQCVPYARQVSGIRIFGDAYTWWDQAEGHYARGRNPRIGAVMAFSPHGNMRLGHVAAVSRIVDSRTVLLRHANWSEIDGRRGQIEDNVRAIDVSPDNDWSEVRVWFAPISGLGTTRWPVRGFIYNQPLGNLPNEGVSTLARRNDDPIGDIIARRMRIASSR
jgi:surface antigen